MNKILRVSAAAGSILLTGALLACAKPGTKPDVTPTGTPTSTGAKQAAPAPAKPRQLGELPRKKAPTAKQPDIVEPRPWTGNFGSRTEIQHFRIVIDEVWRDCIVNHLGAMHCFNSTDAP